MKNRSLIIALCLGTVCTFNMCNSAMASEYPNLLDAIADTTTPRIYTLDQNESFSVSLGIMGGASSTLTIDGSSNRYGIIGNSSHSGIAVNNGQSLIVKNIGSATIDYENATYTYERGFEGFKRPNMDGTGGNGGAIRNLGNLTINDVVFYNNAATGAGSAIYNNGTINEITGKFISNRTGAAAIANHASNNASKGIIERIEADFIYNRGSAHGGAIYNYNGGRINNITNSNFIFNTATNSGAGIRNFGAKTDTLRNYINVSDSLFRFNAARHGGAVHNDLYSSADISGSTFDRNYAVTNESTTRAKSGGAIYNESEMNITDSNFTGNATIEHGGAIFNVGQLSISAKDEDVLFTDNKHEATITGNSAIKNVTGGSYNDVYLGTSTIDNGVYHGTLTLNANSGQSITFNGSIVSESINNTITLNSDPTIKGGDYIFNNLVSKGIMTINNGAKIQLGSYAQSDITTSYGTLELQQFKNDANGGSINSQNYHIDSNDFGALVLNSDLHIDIDADLSAKTVDTFNASLNSVTVNGHKIIIDSIKLLTDASDINTEITLTDNIKFKNVFKLSDDIASYIDKYIGVTGTYSIDYSDFGILSDGVTSSGLSTDEGILIFTKTNDEEVNLVKQVQSPLAIKGYELYADEYVTEDLGELQGISLEITGNNFNVYGNNHGGIIINDGKTLNVTNVGSLNDDGTVATAWQGFTGTVFKVNSGGTLNFNDTNVLANNTGTTNLIENSGTISNFNLHIIDNTVDATTAGDSTPAIIYNENGTIGAINGVIKGNTLKTRAATGHGIIQNFATTSNATIEGINGDIIGNTVQDTANTMRGGIIYNVAKSGKTASIGDITGNIEGNTIKAKGNNSNAMGIGGGIIRNEGDSGPVTIGNISGSIDNNTIELTIGEIYGALIQNKANGRSAVIGDISGDITNNTVTSGGRLIKGLIFNESGKTNGREATINSITGTISNNTINSITSTVIGGIISNLSVKESIINTISGDITDNSINVKDINGGVISNYSQSGKAEIGTISSLIKDNTINVSADSTGLIISNQAEGTHNAHIGSISGDITDNKITGTGSADFTGGIIYNSGTNAVIDEISGTINGNVINTTGNIAGGIIYNNTGSTISSLTSDITNNIINAGAVSGSEGAIIYNNGVLNIIDASIKDNATTAETSIVNNGTLTITADSANIIFENNKVGATITQDPGTEEYIVSGGSTNDIKNTATLNLYAKSGKTITFNGTITDNTSQSGTITVNYKNI